MGNFLDAPKVDKETEVGSDTEKNLSFGVSAMQGWRAQMEDDHLHLCRLHENVRTCLSCLSVYPASIIRGSVRAPLCSPALLLINQICPVTAQLPDLALFGVYDGHGGDSVAHYTAKNFCKHLVNTGVLTANMKPEEVEAKAKQAFEIALMAIDKEMSEMEAVESGHDQSGSTSVMTLLSSSHIVCANTGDSRAVMSRAGTCIELSHDHKPYNPKEKERIEAAGGQVKFNRVNGDLAVSRALGDFVYKRCATADAKEQAVTAFPEIISEARSLQDEFIVLACDGIWDVMSSAEVVDKVREMLLEGRPEMPPLDPDGDSDGPSGSGAGGAAEQLPPPPRPWDLGAVCECLIDHCLRLGSRDNMSVIIVLLNPAMAPKPEQGEPRPAGSTGKAQASKAADAVSSSSASSSSAAASSSLSPLPSSSSPSAATGEDAAADDGS